MSSLETTPWDANKLEYDAEFDCVVTLPMILQHMLASMVTPEVRYTTVDRDNCCIGSTWIEPGVTGVLNQGRSSPHQPPKNNNMEALVHCLRFGLTTIVTAYWRNSGTNIASFSGSCMQQYSDDYQLAHNPPFFFLEPADKQLGSDKAKKGSDNIAGL